MSKYATTLKDYMTKVGDLMDQLKALGDPNNIEYGTDAYNQYHNLLDQYYDIEYPYDASTKLNDALTSLDETASPSKKLNDLDKLIQDKLDDIQQ